MVQEKKKRTGFGVTLEAQHDLGSTVPASGDVLGHESNVWLCIVTESTRQSEITDLELAVGVDEQVAGLQVTVENISRVDVFEAAADLINKVLEVSVGQGLLRSNNLVKVGLHQLLDQVAKRKERKNDKNSRTKKEWVIQLFVFVSCPQLTKPWKPSSIRPSEQQYLHLVEVHDVGDIHVEDRGDLLIVHAGEDNAS